MWRLQETFQTQDESVETQEDLQEAETARQSQQAKFWKDAKIELLIIAYTPCTRLQGISPTDAFHATSL